MNQEKNSNFQSGPISLDGTRLKTEQVTGVKVMNSGLQPYATKSRSQNSMSDTQSETIRHRVTLPLVNQTDRVHSLGRVNEGAFHC